MANEISGITFRSLFSRLARYHRDDCIDPIRTRKESDYDGLIRSLYLLGADISLVFSKKQLKQELDLIKQTSANLKNKNFLKEFFRSGVNPQVRIEWLEREIAKLSSELENFQIADNYRQIEKKVDELTQAMRNIEKNKEIIKFQLSGIDKMLVQHPDISKDDLLELYKGLQKIFREEALEHFDAVQRFHASLATNRQKRLEQDRNSLLQDLEQGEIEWQKLAKDRDGQLRYLQGKHALDEYTSLAHSLASLAEEKEHLIDFLTYSDKLQDRAQKIKEKRLEEDKLAFNFVRKNPLKKADEEFKKIAELLYPRHASGIVLEDNSGDNQLRYNLSVQITGDSSDGINSARILCFDWVMLMHGAHHSIGFLWHDNRLFADIDPISRARWFSHVIKSNSHVGKQYIASINTENFNTMLPFLSKFDKHTLESAVKLVLRGDKPENRLFGFHFGL